MIKGARLSPEECRPAKTRRQYAAWPSSLSSTFYHRVIHGASLHNPRPMLRGGLRRFALPFRQVFQIRETQLHFMCRIGLIESWRRGENRGNATPLGRIVILRSDEVFGPARPNVRFNSCCPEGTYWERSEAWLECRR